MVDIISDETFEEKVLKASTQKPAVIDFFAPWCGPCRALSPIVDEVADEVGEAAVFFKMNVDESPRTAAIYGIRSIPVLMIFKNGKLNDTMNGSHSKKDVLEFVRSALKS